MTPEQLNLRHLRAFYAIYTSQSISKATNIVYLSQPAITQAINKLEQQFKTSLFIRKTTGMYANDSGKILASRVKRMIAFLQEGIQLATKNARSNTNVNYDNLLSSVTSTQLRAIIAISNGRSYSNAARQINVSQSSLHRVSRELETLLGITIFEKTSLGIMPTKPGMILIKYSKIAFSEISQAIEEIGEIEKEEASQLRIGSMPLARTSILPESIIEFSAHYPNHSIQIADGAYDDLIQHLSNADIDILIGALRFPVPDDDLVQEELFSSGVVFVGRVNHPLLQQSDITLDKLAQCEWVVPKIGAPTRNIFNQIFSAHGYSPNRIIESNSHILIRHLLINSDILTTISQHQFQHEIDAGLFNVIPFNMNHAQRPIGITLRKNWQPTSSQKIFLDILKKNSKYYQNDD